MGLAPVIDIEQVRRRRQRVATARALQATGCPFDQIVATTSDTELQDLWTLWRISTSLARLTGYPASFFRAWDAADLVELEQAVTARLMRSAPGWERATRAVIAARKPRYVRMPKAPAC